MKDRSGAVRIFLYNWPTYVGTWSLALVAIAVLRFLPPRLAFVGALAAGVAIVWSLVSLAVSFYVYDRSELASGGWLPRLLRASPSTWATIHAGLDAEVELDAAMTGTCIGRLDVFDAGIMTAPSIERARRRTATTHRATPCSPARLVLDDESCDAIVVAFTAHEIRDRGTRERFFDELRRALRPSGKVVLVEHVRDLANFAAFGPGYLHFQSRAEWLRLAARARLSVAAETRITPWVMALSLERAP